MGKSIMFWAPMHGQSRTSSCMCATGIVFHQMYNESVVMTHNQLNMADLEGMCNQRMDEVKRKELYAGTGLTALLMYFKQAPITKETISNCVIPSIFSDNLFLLPGVEISTVAKNESMESILLTLLGREVPNCFDWTFIDLASGNNQLSQKLFDYSDVLVVCLPHSVAKWNEFFEAGRYLDVIHKKNVFYVIGDYHEHSRYNRKYFIHHFHDYLNEKNCGCVPSCVGYMDALSDGLAEHFLYANKNSSKNDENAFFMNEVRALSTKLRAFVSQTPYLSKGEDRT